MIENLKTHLQRVVGERHPISSPTALLQTEQYVTSELVQHGWEVTTQEFDWRGMPCRNIIAELPVLENGEVVQRESAPLIIGAHFDTVQGSPGADDNGSGIAVLLEVARGLSRQAVRKPIRLIAFSMEEDDLAGSLAYAKALHAQGKKIYGALILECVGFASNQEQSQQTPPGLPITIPSVGDFLGIVGNQDSVALLHLFESAARQSVPELKTISLAVPGQGEMFPDTRRSDHASFWHYGFPALMLTDTADFRNPNYHSSTDTFETLDFTFMSRVTEAVMAAVLAFDQEA